MQKNPRIWPIHPQIKTLGDHLRVKRLDLGLSQKQVAEELSIEKTTLKNWETKRA